MSTLRYLDIFQQPIRRFTTNDDHLVPYDCSCMLLTVFSKLSNIVSGERNQPQLSIEFILQSEGSKYFTLNRGVGFSPLMERTIQFSEPPEAQLLSSVPLDEEWKFRSSASLFAAATPSPYHDKPPS